MARLVSRKVCGFSRIFTSDEELHTHINFVNAKNTPVVLVVVLVVQAGFLH